MAPDVADAAVVYQVRVLDADAHLFEVACRIEKPNPEGQAFSMPAWIPGSYMIRDYARHVIGVGAESGGHEVRLSKTDKSTWRAAPADGPLLIRAEIYANDLSVRGAFLDRSQAFFNGVCLFFRIDGFSDQRCVIHIAPPDHVPESSWMVATGLERLTGGECQFGAFTALSYEELIDRPVMMGELSIGRFEVNDKKHVIAMTGNDDADLDRLGRDLQAICAGHVNLFGELPVSRYVFLMIAVHNGYGGLEHCNSSTLMCSHDSLPRPGEKGVPVAYRDLLGLASHEYFHLWNVKRIRPVEFLSGELSSEAYTRQLWVFEGITSYYDDLCLLRSERIGSGSYLELLGRTLTRVYRSGGRRRQTLEESSFDAWIKFYKQDENAPNAIVSYYTKGAMVALALDLELRLSTEGKCSLDDVMRAMWDRYGRDGSRGLPEGGFETVAEEVSGVNLHEFFRNALRTTIDPPVGISLAQFGVRLHMRARETDDDRGGKPGKRQDVPRAWLGFQARKYGDRMSLRYVPGAGPAREAGLTANDEIVAINGTRVTAGNYRSLLDRMSIDQTVEIDVFRRDRLMRVSLIAAAAPRDTCYLSIDEDAEPAAVGRRLEWLGC
jgi:predicted metalloprotease with PDZ domain